jgi:hypothetical protein
MRRCFFFLGIFLLEICEARAQAFSIFPRDFLNGVEGNKHPWLDSIATNDSNASKPLQFGALNASFFERSLGGENTHLWALQWGSDSAFLDSGTLVPVVLVDYFGTDTFKNTVWFVSDADTALLSFNWVEKALLSGAWRNVAWEERWQRGDSFAYFVLRDYLLPLPCNHESMHLYFGGSDEITLTIDGDFVSGLNWEECLVFIQEQVAHIKSYHELDCLDSKPQLTLEIGIRNPPIAFIRDFMQRVSLMGLRIELIFPWKP